MFNRKIILFPAGGKENEGFAAASVYIPPLLPYVTVTMEPIAAVE